MKYLAEVKQYYFNKYLGYRLPSDINGNILSILIIFAIESENGSQGGNNLENQMNSIDQNGIHASKKSKKVRPKTVHASKNSI